MIIDFLKKLGANTKITVGVSVSPGVGLEMIEVDRATKTVAKYGCKPLDYDPSSREIKDYKQFQEALEELFTELHIPKKSNIILTMPSVHFGLISLPLLLTDDAITNAIISEVEQSYIFKRQEPVVSWVELSSNADSENRRLAYTAIQQVALDGIKAACDEVGCTLSSIENSFSSFLKAIYYANLAEEQMKENITWNLMIIGQNNYSIFSMVDKKIVDFYEEPLALKSFVDDEIYNAISSSAQITLSTLPANYLFLASETDLVSAEVLSMKISSGSTVKFLETNKYTQDELLPVNLDILPNFALKITPEAIGSAIYPFCDFPIKFNLTGEKDASAPEASAPDSYPVINVGGLEIELTPIFIKKIGIIVALILIIPTVIIMLVLENFLTAEKSKLADVNSQLQKSKDELAKYESKGSGAFDASTEVKKIILNNRNRLLYYDALGMSIPNKLWITYYMTNSADGVDIKGMSSDVESVYSFYKNIKQLVNNSNIKLYKLEIDSNSLDQVVNSSSNNPKYYTFEITNMSEAELNPPVDPKDATKSGTNPPAAGAPPAPTPAGSPPPNPQAPPSSAAPPTPPAQDNGLPKNLEKIEKF